MISSTSNNRIKNVIQLSTKAKVRKEQDAYVVEGIRMFREAPKACIKEIYMTEEICKKEKLEKYLEGEIPCELVTSEVFLKMSDTKTPQGILCVMKRPGYCLEEEMKKGSNLWVVLENIQDPGNLGTILRTGEGAGINGVIMSKNTVDIYNPKTIRSTMGSIYRVPFFYVDDLNKTLTMMKQNNITTYAAHLKGKASYDKFDFQKSTAFLIGNEGNGLTEETANLADEYLRIPMEGEVESLNAAMACGILMYEAHRQRN